MKTFVVGVLLLLLGVGSACGQGQFVFNNRVPPDVDARIVNHYTQFLPGSNADIYTVQLVGGPVGSAMSTWTELGTTSFRTGAAAGYVNPITVTVPGATTSADFVLRLFEARDTSGSPFDYIYDYYGDRTVFTTPVAVAPNPPPNAPLGTTPLFFGVPEPSTLWLAAVGCGFLFFKRSRSCRSRPGARKNY